MAKFILIDHSLCGLKGHHYEYAVHVLGEAQRAGYEIVLATNRQFRHRSALPQTWRVFPLFPYDVYNRHSMPWRRKGRAPWSRRSAARAISPWKAGNLTGWLARLHHVLRRLDHQRRLKRFAGACDRLFRAVTLQPDDIVFMATISPFDLEGLPLILQQRPETAVATWHLQFHHDILEGYDADDDQQAGRRQSSRRLLEQTLRQIPNHRLVFHTTTDQLASEYNRLAIGTFGELPYPVNPRFHAPESPAEAKRCLNILCAGGMRREKGSHQMAQLIRGIWRPHLADGRVRLHIQANRRRFGRLSRDQERFTSRETAQPLVRVPHPLEMDDYVKLIHKSDIGLFLYDKLSYRLRCSGILVEMLAAGRPVIVPAECWLARQIAEPNYRYLDRMDQEIPAISRRGMDDVGWNRPRGAGPMRRGGEPHVFRADLATPQGATAMLTRLWLTAADDLHRYVHLRCEQQSAHGECLDQWVSVLGRREQGDLPISALIPLDAHAGQVTLFLHAADNEGAVEITDFQCTFLDARDSCGRNLPSGAVGVAAANVTQIPRLLAELVDHYDHYRRTAEAFSHEWMRHHAPRNTLATLLARDVEARSRNVKDQAA